jgi:hypothetical protein
VPDNSASLSETTSPAQSVSADAAVEAIDSGAGAVDDAQPGISAVPAAKIAHLADISEAEVESTPTPTADLMAALRKRRSENHDAPSWLAEAATAQAPSAKSGSITDELAEMQNTQPVKTSRTGSSRRQRAQMPTWDEIVFGTKVDDDLI